MTRAHAKLICFLVLSLVTRLLQSFAEMRETNWHRYMEPEAMGAIMPPRSYFSLFTPLAASVCYDLHFFSKDSMTFILACGVLFSVSLRFWSFFFSFPVFHYMAWFSSSVCSSFYLNFHVPCKKAVLLAFPQRQSTETSSLQSWRWFRTSEWVIPAQDVGSPSFLAHAWGHEAEQMLRCSMALYAENWF